MISFVSLNKVTSSKPLVIKLIVEVKVVTNLKGLNIIEVKMSSISILDIPHTS